MKSRVKQSLAFAGVLAASLMMAPEAKAVSFNLGGSNGPGNVISKSFTEGDFGLEVNAFADKTPQAFVFESGAGLGVNRARQDLGQIDGGGVSEYLRLNFDRAVRLVSFKLSSVENRTSALVTSNNGEVFNGSVGGPNAFGNATLSFTNGPTGTYFDFTGIGSGDNYLLSSIEVEPVPEPLTILGTGLALAAGAAFERKRSKQKHA